jgi:hypothetical protein
LDDPRVPRGTQTASRISPPTTAMTLDNSTPASPQQSHPSISPPTNMSTAATRARSRIRDVFFYDLQDSCALLGGLVLTRGITNVDFYTMVGIVIITSTTFFLQDDNGQTVPNDAQPLSIGNYFVVSDSPIYLNDEQIVMRTISPSTGTRQHEFREQVRQRDGRCVVSKVENVLSYTRAATQRSNYLLLLPKYTQRGFRWRGDEALTRFHVSGHFWPPACLAASK